MVKRGTSYIHQLHHISTGKLFVRSAKLKCDHYSMRDPFSPIDCYHDGSHLVFGGLV